MSRCLQRSVVRGALWLWLAAAVLLVGTAAARPVRSDVKRLKGPFTYDTLGVRNSCFVEAVNFYDEYMRRGQRGNEPWARVLQWGNEIGDYKMTAGHAVAVFADRGKLWCYDINYGMVELPVGLDRRGDIHDVSPPIFAKYPQYNPIRPLYREDFPQEPMRKRVKFLFYHANRDIRDATRVANSFSAVRPVRVFEYDFTDKGKTQHSAATTFVFGARLCVYFPRYGTFVAPNSTLTMGSVDDLRFLKVLVRRLFKDGGNVRWQPGGYAFFPPKAE
jgi:hypothetical protein